MYNAKEINKDIATLAWSKSTEVSLFSCPQFLCNLGYKTRFFGGYKNNELLVVWPMVETECGFNKPPLYSYYFGPYWVDSKYHDTPYKLYRNNLEVFNYLIPIIEKLASNLSFSVVPEFKDLRPFQWWNYNNPQGHKFKIDLRYTGRYNFRKVISNEDLIKSFRADDKRKKIRSILKMNYLKTSWGQTNNTEAYLDLYRNTMSRSGVTLTLEQEEKLKNIFNFEADKLNSTISVRILELFFENSSKLEGFQLLIIGKGQIYAIAQCVSEEARGLNGSIALSYNSLTFANQTKSLFDFNGANSPLRADDKHAFGSEIVKYFDLCLGV